MGKITKFCTALPLLLILCGCMGGTSIVTVEQVPAGTEYQNRKVLGIIQAENRGMYLFGVIPIWSGKPHQPNYRKFTMFRNYLRAGYMDQMLMDEARRMKAEKVVVSNSSTHSSGWFSLWIVWNSQYHAEGIALGSETTSAK
jgi:hypothetical protein